jgi:hypothetical protein
MLNNLDILNVETGKSVTPCVCQDNIIRYLTVDSYQITLWVLKKGCMYFILLFISMARTNK